MSVSGIPALEHLWLQTYGKNTRSPYLELSELGCSDLVGLLREGGEVEQDFDVIGRRLKQLGMWNDSYKSLWRDAFRSALTNRQKIENQTLEAD